MTQLEWEVQVALRKYRDLARAKYNREFPLPFIKYDLKGRVAGRAYWTMNTIRINLQLLQENTADYLSQTLPHEFAHLVSHQLHRGKKTKPHGPEWQRVMRDFGLEPLRCHNYDVTPARNTRKFRYICLCCKHDVGPKIHRKIARGVKYTCRKCKSSLVLLNENNPTAS